MFMKIGWHILKNGYLLTIAGAEGKEEKPPRLMSNGPESVLKKRFAHQTHEDKKSTLHSRGPLLLAHA